LKTIKHILGISQLFVFLAFVAIGGLQGILQSEKNVAPDHVHVNVQHKQNTCLEQGIFEIDVEKETDGGKFLKNAACLYSTQASIFLSNPPARKEINQFPQPLLHSRPIFLELHNFRI